MYTTKQLKTCQVKDLLIDIRCAYRDGLYQYAMECERQVINLVSKNAIMDKYGFFKVIEL